MVSIGDITKYLEPIAPSIGKLLLFIIPIYIKIGEILGGIAIAFVGMLPTDSNLWGYIIGGVFLVLGLVFGIISEKKQKEKQGDSPESGPKKAKKSKKGDDDLGVYSDAPEPVQ